MGISFLPVRNMLGTDTALYSAAKEIICPFTGKTYLAVPALYPDVAIIHVHEADIYGNSHIKGILVSDLELARASKRVIISCERLVSIDFFRNDAEKTSIPYYLVDAVVEVPYGSYPGNMPYEYYSDEEHLAEWLAMEENEETYRSFLDRYIFNLRDFNEYLYLCGGLEKLKKLRDIEFLIQKASEGSEQK